MKPRGTTVTVISAGQHHHQHHHKSSSPSPSPELKLASTLDHRLSGSLGTTGKSGVMGGGGGPMVLTTTCTAQRDSDEYPITGGITQTVQVEWSVETTTKPHHQHGGR